MRATAISPDGSLIASGGADAKVRVWELASGRAVWTFDAHQKEVTCLAFSADGKHLLSGANDATIHVWDLAKGTSRLRLVSKGGVNDIAVSPDGKRLAAIYSDRTWGVWDLADGRPLFLRPHGGLARSVAFCPDSRHCLTGGDNCVYAWDVETGGQVFTFPATDTAAMAVSPGGDQALTAGAYEPPNPILSLKLWRLQQDGPMLAEFPGQPCPARQITFTRDGARALVAGADGVVRQVNLADRTVRPVCWGDGAPLSAVSFSPDHFLAASGSADGTVYVWDLAGSERSGAAQTFATQKKSMAVSADGSHLLLGSHGGTVSSISLRAQRGTAAEVPLLARQPSAIQVVAPTPDQSLVLTGAEDGAVRLWQAADGKDLGELGRHDGDVRAIACAPDGRFAVSVNGNEAILWDLPRRKRVWSARAGETIAHGAAFSADGRVVWASTTHGKVVGWDVADGHPLSRGVRLQSTDGDALRLEQPILFLRDASLVLTAKEPEHDLVLWDARTGAILRQFHGHSGTVDTLTASPDEKIVASGGRDGVVRIWEIDTGRELPQLRYTPLPVRLLRFSPDGRRLYSTGPEDCLNVWDLDRAEQYRQFQARLRAAREELNADPRDRSGLVVLRQWYQFRNRQDLADGLKLP